MNESTLVFFEAGERKVTYQGVVLGDGFDLGGDVFADFFEYFSLCFSGRDEEKQCEGCDEAAECHFIFWKFSENSQYMLPALSEAKAWAALATCF